MSRFARALSGVLLLSLVAMGLVVGPGAVASVPSAESDFSVQFDSDGSLLPSFDAETVASERVKRIAEQGRGTYGPREMTERPEGPQVGAEPGDVRAAETSFYEVDWLIPGATSLAFGFENTFDVWQRCAVLLFDPDTGEELDYQEFGGEDCYPAVYVASTFHGVDLVAGREYKATLYFYEGETYPDLDYEGYRQVAEYAPGFGNGLELGVCICGTSVGIKAPYPGFTVNPVNLATGEKTESVTDVGLPGPGVGFDLSRVYSSGNEHVGLLGRGWVFPYEARLDVSDPDRIVYHAESGQRAVYERDAGGDLVSPAGSTSELVEVTGGFELRTRSHETLSFDAGGLLTGWVDASGEGLSFGYSGGVLNSVTDAAGRQVDVTVAGGKVTSVTLPDGRSVSYGYDGDLLTSVTDLRGQVWSYGYGAAGRLRTITDPLGRVVKEATYNSAGRVVSQVDATGVESTWAYDTPLTGDTTYTDARGGIWTYTHSGNVLVQQIDPVGNITSYFYDKNLNPVEEVDPRGNATLRKFDDRGNRVSETNAAGHTQTWVYDTDDNLIEQVGPTGIVSTWEYNAAHLPVRETQTAADGSSSRSRTWGYDARGLMTGETSWGGRETTFTYDAAGNRVTQTSGEGNTTRWSYDGSGRVLTETDPRGDGQDGSYTTSYAYDDGGNIVTLTDPRSHQTGYAYDPVGNLASESLPDGSTTTYEWDAAGRVISKLRSGWEQPETYLYYAGVDGQLGAQTDATGAVTKWGYDAANRMTSMRLPRGSLPGATPDEHTYRYAYDRAGNRIEERDPAGNRTEFGYNVLDWMTSATDPAGGVTRFTYNRAGMVRTVTDPNGSRTVTQWDGLLREDRLTDARGNVTTQTWDPDDLLESVTTPLGHTTGYGYDAEGRQTAMVDPRGTSRARTRRFSPGPTAMTRRGTARV